MKAVLISINPTWCELIASGQKTIEVRKTKPKISTPFKCYIYCTYGSPTLGVFDTKISKCEAEDFDWYNRHTLFQCNGKVIGEFVMNNIDKYTAEFVNVGCCYEDIRICVQDAEDDEDNEIILTSNTYDEPDNCYICKQSCLSFNEIKKYVSNGKTGFFDFYGWHISDLKIYDTPKELSHFYTICPEWKKEKVTVKCQKCQYHFLDFFNCVDGCMVEGERPLAHAPQSWCYVNERTV